MSITRVWKGQEGEGKIPKKRLKREAAHRKPRNEAVIEKKGKGSTELGKKGIKCPKLL